MYWIANTERVGRRRSMLCTEVGITLMTLGSFRWLIAILSAGPMLAAPCESLRSLSLPHAMVTSAQAVGAGAFTAPETGGRGRGPGASFQDLPAFCRVAITVTP